MLLSDFIQARREKRIETVKAEGIAEGEARAYRKCRRVGSSPKGSRSTRRGVHRTAPNTAAGTITG